MKRVTAIVILLSAVSGALWGAEVTRVAKNGRVAIVSMDSGTSWHVGDRICLQRSGKNLCGRITKIASQRAVVQFDNQGPAVSVGELVATDRATTSRREPTAEPDFSDLRDGSSKSDSSASSSSNDQRYRFNGTGGLDFIYPTASVSYAISNTVALGLSGDFYSFSYQGVSAGINGANLILTGYLNQMFRGWWGELGVGLYSAGVTYKGGTDKVLAGNIQLLGGYRWKVGSRLNLGLGGGVRDISLAHSSALHFSLNLWLPMVRFDVGFTF